MLFFACYLFALSIKVIIIIFFFLKNDFKGGPGS